MKKTILILLLLSFNAKSGTVSFSINSGDLVGDAYNYFSGNSQDNPTIFDSSATKRQKLEKLKSIQNKEMKVSISNSEKIRSITQKESKFLRVLETPITKNGLKEAGIIASEGIIAEKGGKSVYKTVTKHALGTVAIGTTAYAAGQIATDMMYKDILKSPIYNELYDTLSAKASIIDDQISRTKRKYCTNNIARIYLNQDPDTFEAEVNNTILNTLQNNNYNDPLFSVNSYKKNLAMLKVYHGNNSDRLTPDHIPSIAAIFKFLQVKSKRKSNYDNNASTINIYRTWHADGSFTYFWKNTKPLIEADSQNLRDSTIRDLSVMGAYILKNASEDDKNKYINRGMMLYYRNATLCLYSKP